MTQTNFDINTLDWGKVDNLMPVIIQHAEDNRVLMLGYMNREAIDKTLSTGKVTFFSRTKQRLWTKGETSGNILELKSIKNDCDQDTLLITAIPHGPTCHTGTDTCFDGTVKQATKADDQGNAVKSDDPLTFLNALTDIIADRKANREQKSYTASLFKEGRSRISQKVGEEGVELALAHMKQDKEEIINESADLIFHMMVLLANEDLTITDIARKLQDRHKA